MPSFSRPLPQPRWYLSTFGEADVKSGMFKTPPLALALGAHLTLYAIWIDGLARANIQSWGGGLPSLYH